MSPVPRYVLIAILIFPFALITAPARAADCPGAFLGSPCLTLTPDHGPVGTRVEISGHIRHNLANWRNQFRDPAYFTLIHDFSATPGGPAVCELLVGTDPVEIHMSANGSVTGSFTVGATGICFQHADDTVHPTRPGKYGLSIGCHACEVAEFTMTQPTLPFTGGRMLVPQLVVGLLAVAVGIALARWRFP